MRPLLLLVVGALSLSCTRAKSDHKSITIGITQEPDTLWMPMKQMNASEHIGRPGALSLTVFDDQWKLIPYAAVAIPKPEVLADGRMRVVWTLKDGLFWADGHPVTADDFVFTYELYKDPRLEIVDRTVTDRVTSMKALDARTLEVIFAEPYAYYAAFRNHEVVPRHLVEPIWRAKGAGLKDDAFGTKPVLGGAFTITEWSPGASITATRNPYAISMKPKLDRIVWRIIPDTTTLEANLLSGSIDAISVVGLPFDQALELQTRLPPQYEMRFTEALNLEHIEFNLDNPVLKDQRVREALLLAIDRQKLVDTLFQGKQPVAWSGEPVRSRFYNPSAAKHAYDPAKARALLDDAGYAGKRIALTLATTAGDKTRELVEEVLVSQWKAVGVDVVVANQPAKILFGETIRHRKFTGMVMFTWTKDPLQINEALWRCDQIPRENNGYKGMNYPGYCNLAVDALLAKMVRELDDDKRDAIGKDIVSALNDDLPILPLYFRQDVSVIPKGFQGWRPTGLLESMAWNAQEWAWP